MRSLTAPASTRIHGPWQITATGARPASSRTKRHRVGVGADGVGVGDAAGQDQAVVVAGVRGGGGAVDGEAVGRIEVPERLDLAVLGGDQLGSAAGLLDRLPRLGELGLLDALVRDDERDASVLELRGHVDLLGSGAMLRARSAATCAAAPTGAAGRDRAQEPSVAV